MWFNNYRFEHKPNLRWRQVRKIKFPDRLLAKLIAEHLAKTTGEEWRVLSGGNEVFTTEARRR